MIPPLSRPGTTAAPAKVGGVAKAGAPRAAAPATTPLPTPAADLAGLGPPVDVDKVSRIRSAIANGSYTIDVQAIAARMVDFDLPEGS